MSCRRVVEDEEDEHPQAVHRVEAHSNMRRETSIESSSSSSDNTSKRRKDMFGDCALVEIIHLHDCLRGALRALQQDVTLLSQAASRTISVPGAVAVPAEEAEVEDSSNTNDNDTANDNDVAVRQRTEELAELEGRVAGRFKVIWSVFRAHSAAEDEFIWPALKQKMSSPSTEKARSIHKDTSSNVDHGERNDNASSSIASGNSVASGHAAKEISGKAEKGRKSPASSILLEAEEYVEDHADEERMFLKMDSLLSKLREGLADHKKSVASTKQLGEHTAKTTTTSKPTSSLASILHSSSSSTTLLQEMASAIEQMASRLSQHLLEHLEKEEQQCMPLVVKHLNQQEINDLVGKIMGKRSSDTIGQILTMAIQTLPPSEQDEMGRYMKQAMVGTFFERWLAMEGYWSFSSSESLKVKAVDVQKEQEDDDRKPSATVRNDVQSSLEEGAASTEACPESHARALVPTSSSMAHASTTHTSPPTSTYNHTTCTNPTPTTSHQSSLTHPQLSYATAAGGAAAAVAEPEKVTQKELEKLIRSIASNPELTAAQKTTTMQGLRDSVWKSNRKRKYSAGGLGEVENNNGGAKYGHEQMHHGLGNVASSEHQQVSSTCGRRGTPPTFYYKRNNRSGKVELVWSVDSHSMNVPPMTAQQQAAVVPLFSASELAPTYHDGATGAVLGCPHYARSCKLRHPSSGRLYTCRLCCEQEREMPLKDQDSPLDRYAVTEVFCMRCCSLQPAGDHCINPKCESRGKPFSKYSCKICNLYDDGAHKKIYHCPFCNVCRAGSGLGIDFRHCMRCNACVSLGDGEHVCIPQRLQGNCPICHETMFESTEPLKGMKCGHVMHLKCFMPYRRSNYTCPLCKKSMEDMKEYFTMLDAAIRMQPMPPVYSNTFSSIYCQDCCKTGNVPYHFVGCKCKYCGSYNTRETERSVAMSISPNG